MAPCTVPARRNEQLICISSPSIFSSSLPGLPIATQRSSFVWINKSRSPTPQLPRLNCPEAPPNPSSGSPLGLSRGPRIRQRLQMSAGSLAITKALTVDVDRLELASGDFIGKQDVKLHEAEAASLGKAEVAPSGADDVHGEPEQSRLRADVPRRGRNESRSNLSDDEATGHVDASTEHNRLGPESGTGELARDRVA